MTVTREPPTRDAVDFIVTHLRERDRREILALRWNDDLSQLTDQIMAVSASPLWSVWSYENTPVALAGASLVRPGAVLVGAFGTEPWSCVVGAMTRDILGRALPLALKGGAHRAEAYALAENTDNRRWIEALGGEQEGLLREYGRDREDFVIFGWRLEHVRRGHVRTHHEAGGGSYRDQVARA